MQKSITLPELRDWETRRQVLSAVDDWSFRGRIAVSDRGDGFNGNLRWSQQQDRFDAEVSGPFGAGSVRLNGRPEHVTVTEKDGTVTELGNAERDLKERYGWTIPVGSLRYWALGIPDPAYAVETELDDTGKLLAMQQGGWTVTIGQYRDGGGQLLPRRISAVRDEARVRLVIDHWIFR